MTVSPTAQAEYELRHADHVKGLPDGHADVGWAGAPLHAHNLSAPLHTHNLSDVLPPPPSPPLLLLLLRWRLPLLTHNLSDVQLLLTFLSFLPLFHSSKSAAVAHRLRPPTTRRSLRTSLL